MFDVLEPRRLMAVTAELSGYLLIVEGDSAANWISIEKSGGLIRVKVYGGGTQEIFHTAENNVDDIEIHGNDGNDILTVSNSITADVTLWGDRGADYLKGGGGYSVMFGQGDVTEDDAANDTLVSGSGPAEQYGGEGNDSLYTDSNLVSGHDYMTGGEGNDTFYVTGHDEIAIILGEEGNDTLVPSQASTQELQFEGGDGFDAVSYRAWSEAAYVKPDGIHYSGLLDGDRLQLIETDVERIDGTDFDDLLSDAPQVNFHYGWAGDDIMFGGGGNDVLIGGDNADEIHGGSGNDLLSGEDGDDLLLGESGNDTASGGDGNDSAHGNSGNDQLYGNADTDYLYGESGNDKLVGGSEADFLDSHDGVFGNDTVFGDNENGTGAGWGILDVAYIDKFSNAVVDEVHGIESVVF